MIPAWALLAGVIYLGVVSLACVAYLRAIYRRIPHMNQAVQAELASLNDKVARLDTLLANERADNAALKTENSDLKTQLEAVPPPPVDDTAEIVAAVQAIEAKADAGIADPSAPPTPPAA